jgi:hypothetical protein
MRRARIINTGEIVTILGQSDGGGTLNTGGIAFCVELKDGSVINVQDLDIQFIDSPETEQRAEFANTANAVLQGLAQRNGWYWQGSGIDENLTGFLPSDFAKMYYELISELKKHKP